MAFIETKNFKLAAYIKGDSNSPKLALVLPGRLDTKDYANNSSLVDYLATQGYLSVSFDPPGTWESDGDISQYTTSSYIKAVHEVIDFYGNKPTILAGHSRGGTVSIMVSETHPEVVGIILLMANFGPPTPPGAEAIRKGFKTSFRDLPPGTQPTKQQKEFALPLGYFDDGEKYNPIEALNKLTQPKLFIYGKNDVFTTPEENLEVYNNAPEPKTIHELITTHDYRYDPKALHQVNEIVGDFLAKHDL